jgi:capsular exopolysaccharide synthesis family protein
LAYIYLKTQPNIYETNAVVLVKNTSNGSTPSELDVFADLGIEMGQTNMYNEIQVLKSRLLIQDVVKELKLNIQYTQLRSSLESDQLLYGSNNPIQIQFKEADSVINKSYGAWRIILKDNKTIEVEEFIEGDFNYLGEFGFNEWIESKLGPVRIVKTYFDSEDQDDMLIQINIQPTKSTINQYKTMINVAPEGEYSSVLKLVLKGTQPELNETFINTLIEQHEMQAIEDKNEIGKNTSDFIDDRLLVFERDLNDIESVGEDFKSSKQLISMESNAEQYMEQSGEMESKLIQSNIENSMAESMLEYLSNDNEEMTLLPTNLGFQDPSIVTSINDYNKLVLERRRVAENSTEQNPLVNKLDKQIISLRQNIRQSLINLEKTLKIRLKELQKKEKEYDEKISNVPSYERQYRDIARQQQIKETIYLYLLQKKEENQISMASAVGTIKLLDPAFTNPVPVSPKRRETFLIALLIGIAIPIVIIYVIDALDTKVRKKKDLEGLGIPFIGEIPKNDTEDYVVVKKDDRSLIAEAFKMIRTNLSFYFAKEKQEFGKVVFLTSTIAGEGKTFNSVNLASTLALTNKKVILLGLDLRAPKIKKFLDIEESEGVSNYIVDDSISIKDITFTNKGSAKFDIIHSGVIPPNPSELLLSPRLEDLLVDLKQRYDYVIVDNPPISLVTDTMSIIHMADMLLYVIRMGSLDKSYLDIPYNLYKDKQINNMALILNDTKHGFGGYRGYGYGYGYGASYGSSYGEKKSTKFWGKLKKRK